jgi:predicted RNA polymerase sigma factor
MGQRPVRAETKIRDVGIQFEIPLPRELPQRLNAVLEAMACRHYLYTLNTEAALLAHRHVDQRTPLDSRRRISLRVRASASAVPQLKR